MAKRQIIKICQLNNDIKPANTKTTKYIWCDCWIPAWFCPIGKTPDVQ